MKSSLVKFAASLIIAVFALPVIAHAQSVSCENDRAKFCSEKKGPQETQLCLMDHFRELDPLCRQELERFLQMRKQAAGRGGGALSGFGGLNAMGPPIPIASYDGRFSPGNDNSSFTENKISISSPIYRNEEETISGSLSGGVFHLGKQVILDSGRRVPIDLDRIETGAQYFKRLPEKKNWGLRGSLGYAGDKPFATSNDLTYSIAANYGFPSSENSSWILFIFFSNNSPLGNYIPIPGASYLYRTETFTGLFGFPITSLQWTPVNPWAFSLSIFGPTIQAEAAYGSVEALQVFTNFGWIRQSYIPNERDNDKDRITIEEKKATVGARGLIGDRFLAEVQAGQTFDRSIYLGNKIFNKDGGTAQIPSDWYFSGGLKYRF